MIEHAYIHIPFCKRKCHYCSFVSGEDITFKKPYINALIHEIKSLYKGEKLKTIYFGGGTPSLLTPEDLNTILSCFNYSPDECEITLEANPETIIQDRLKDIKDIGFNRISLGIQTFNDNILHFIGRNHNKDIILDSLDNVKKTGFQNISIDLIYGLPFQTKDLFIEDIKNALSLDIQHISSYGLKIENNSYFGKNPPPDLPDEDSQANMYILLCNMLEKNNFKQYEISNFSKEGFESKHNLVYWKNKQYYGFGLNASGFENNIRYKNTSIFNKYIENPLQKEEELILTTKEQTENEIFLALRLKEGINIQELNNKYNINFIEKYKEIIEKYSKLNMLIIDDGRCRLTQEGTLLSNIIMSEFID